MNLFNRLVVGTLPAVPRPVVRYFANRYIAGETIDEAISCVRDVNSGGKLATLDVLGEDVTGEEETRRATEQNIRVLRAIAAERVDSNLSIKLTSLGLKLGKPVCLENVREILKEAKSLKNFVRFDMEDSTCTQDTIGIFRKLQREFSAIGIVLQAYMRRSVEDARKLIETGTNFRLCKGIYREPPGIAFQEKEEVRENFLKLLGLMFDAGSYVGIATHDSVLVRAARKMIRDRNLRDDQYEFQMLLGVRPELRENLVADGHRVRLYVPFGESWYAYSMRRFKENPEVAGYILKAMFTRNV